MSEIKAHQPLDVSDGMFMLVTITMRDMDEHPTPDIIHQFVMPYTTKSINWINGLGDHRTKVTYERIGVMSEPKAVHAVLNFPDGDTTGCPLHSRRWQKYHQTLDQAFYRVTEAVTCKTCLKAIADPRWAKLWWTGEQHGAVLKQWSWDNVDEDYRPNGPMHHFSRPSA